MSGLSWILKSSREEIPIANRDEIPIMDGDGDPLVKCSADISSRRLKLLHVRTATEVPCRGLLMECANDFCFLEDGEQFIINDSEKFTATLVTDQAPTGTVVKEENNAPKRPRLSDDTGEGEWTDHKHIRVLEYKPRGSISSDKCACFDMDGTLITTRSGKRFPENSKDWKILFDGVAEKRIEALHKEGYHLAIFSNQRGLANGKSTPDELKEKCSSLLVKLKVPMFVFLSYGLGTYRKPLPGLWNLLKNRIGAVDKSKSFYVGDAAGRPKDWQANAKKDHSKCDRLFAVNVGLEFKTPEEFFLKRSPAKFEMPHFDPKTLKTNKSVGTLLEPRKNCPKEFKTIEDLTRSDTELIVSVGYPASGKSWVASQLKNSGYEVVNQDTLRSLPKCVKVAGDVIAAGGRVVIDNTNFQKDQRAKFIELAKQAGYPVRCLWFDMDIDQVRHNNKFRLLTTPDAQHKDVSDITLYSMRKKFQMPELAEGFDEIIRMTMVPVFETKQREELFYMYLLED